MSMKQDSVDDSTTLATCRQTVEASLATPTTAWQRLATIRDRKGSDNLWRNMP